MKVYNTDFNRHALKCDAILKKSTEGNPCKYYTQSHESNQLNILRGILAFCLSRQLTGTVYGSEYYLGPTLLASSHVYAEVCIFPCQYLSICSCSRNSFMKLKPFFSPPYVTIHTHYTRSFPPVTCHMFYLFFAITVTMHSRTSKYEKTSIFIVL